MKKSLLIILLAPILLFAQDGTFTGSAQGKRGAIDVSVTVQNGKLSNIVVTESKEDGKYASEQIIRTMLKNNNINIDSVSGASFTSRGTVQAVKNALGNQAGNFTGARIKPTR